jgi:hypothetical protein
MMDIRPQVKAFLDAAETLLSSALLTSPLNEDERGMIKMYMESLDEKIVANVDAPGSSEKRLPQAERCETLAELLQSPSGWRKF